MARRAAERLAASVAYLHGLAGHAEVPNADAEALRETCREAGIDQEWSDCLAGSSLELGQLAASKRPQVAPDEVPWPSEPGKIPERPATPRFDVDLLPQRLRRWVADVGRQASIPCEMIAVPAMVALGSIVGRSVTVRPDVGSSWSTPPNLWGAVCASPGTMKSHAIGAGLAPLKGLAARTHADWEDGRSHRDAQRIVAEEELARLKRVRGATTLELQAAIDDVERTTFHERRYLTSDSTVERLAILFQQNPRGILLLRDELGGWISALSKAGHEGDREFFLEAWNGDGSFIVDRVGRGTLHIDSMCLSVIGALQPARLERLVAEGGTEDGLMQRLQMLVYPDPTPYRRSDDPPDEHAARDAHLLFEAIDRECSTPRDRPVRLDPHAQRAYDAWRDELEVRLRSRDLEGAPALCSHLAKYRGLVPSIALIISLCDERSPAIGLGAMERAIRWAWFLEPHARRAYLGGGGEACAPATRELVARIKSGAIEHGETLRQIHRSRWAEKHRPEDLAAAFEQLELRSWVRRIRSHGATGRPSIILHLHPRLRVPGG